MLKKISAGKLSFLLSALLAFSILINSGCGAWGKDAPASSTLPDIPPTTSWVPMFIQLANQPGTLPALNLVIRDMMITGQLQMVISALDSSLRETGAAKMKELLRLILKDPVLREFAAPNGPLSVILAYQNMGDLLDVVHNLTISGITENAMVPMLKAVANSPLMRSFEPFGRELLRDGIPQVLPLVNGMATEMVPYSPSSTGYTPAFTPLLGVMTKNAIYDPDVAIMSDPTSFLAKNIINLMANEADPSNPDITTPVTPLLALVGSIATELDNEPVLARNIVNGLGMSSGVINSSVMGGLRKTVYDYFISTVTLYPPNSSSGMIPTPTSMIDELYYILARDNSKGAWAIFNKLKELESDPQTAGILQRFVKAYAPYYTKNCVQTVDDFLETNNPFVMKFQDVDIANGKYSCFMQIMRLVYDTYKYQLDLPVGLTAQGFMATCGALKCAENLDDNDPVWTTATKADPPYNVCGVKAGHGNVAPALPIYPHNVAADYMYEMSRRTTDVALKYTKYMVCILHEQLAGKYLYEWSFPFAGPHLINDTWESVVVGFTVMGNIGDHGGLELLVPILDTLRKLDEPATTGGYVYNLTSVLALVWGDAGREVNPLSPVLNATFGCVWDPLAPQLCKAGSVESGMMYNVMPIVVDILLGDITVRFKGSDNYKSAVQILIEGLTYMVSPLASLGGSAPLRQSVGIPLYAFIQPDIDQFITFAAPGLQQVFIKPQYKAENIFHLLSIVLDERVGNPSFTDYVDPTTAYYMPDFKNQAYEIVNAFVPPMGSASGYLLENDPDGIFAAALSYMITNPTTGDSVAISALNLFDELLDYNQNNIFLDFLSNFLNTGAFVILMEATDAANQSGNLLAVIPAAQTLVKYGVMPEFMDLLYQLIPLVSIGE